LGKRLFEICGENACIDDFGEKKYLFVEREQAGNLIREDECQKRRQ
jgi:hypothetical protein